MTFPAKHISVSIERSANEVYVFASNPENLPRWASGLSTGIRKEGNDWVADSPMGAVTIRFAEANPFGVLDHVVTLPSGEAFDNPMRVFPNDNGSECVFTLFRRPDMSDEAFDADSGMIEKDLQTLKNILEHRT